MDELAEFIRQAKRVSEYCKAEERRLGKPIYIAENYTIDPANPDKMPKLTTEPPTIYATWPCR